MLINIFEREREPIIKLSSTICFQLQISFIHQLNAPVLEVSLENNLNFLKIYNTLYEDEDTNTLPLNCHLTRDYPWNGNLNCFFKRWTLHKNKQNFELNFSSNLSTKMSLANLIQFKTKTFFELYFFLVGNCHNINQSLWENLKWHLRKILICKKNYFTYFNQSNETNKESNNFKLRDFSFF